MQPVMSTDGTQTPDEGVDRVLVDLVVLSAAAARPPGSHPGKLS
jgi:hypothetical protein